MTTQEIAVPTTPAFKLANPEESMAKKVKSGTPFFTPPGKEGEYTASRVRILPPRIDHPDGAYFWFVATHGDVPNAQRPVYCPAKNDSGGGSWCPMCDVSQQFRKQGQEKQSLKYSSSWRVLVNVLPLNLDGSLPKDAQVKVWGFSNKMLEKLKAKISQMVQIDPSRNIDISHPLLGTDVIINRIGTGTTNTEYELALAPTSTELAPEAIPLLNKMIDLTAVYEPMTGAAIKAIMENKEGSADRPFDDDDEPNLALPTQEVTPAIPAPAPVPTPPSPAVPVIEGEVREIPTAPAPGPVSDPQAELQAMFAAARTADPAEAAAPEAGDTAVPDGVAMSARDELARQLGLSQ